MERYNEYKDSGVQWLGEIPSHWDMQRWRFLLTENKVKNTDCKEKVQLQFKYGDIVRKANQDEDADVLEAISKYTVVAPDDIMINGLNLNYDFISQRVAQVRENGVITSAYVSLRPTSLACSRYYTYFLKSMDFKKMFHGMGTGIRLTLSYNELKNQFIPFPAIIEQQAIADYLDTATAKIDEAIAQQQKMIDLLNERKQIIINNAVTKGLNPDVPMKDSGVDWIGEIPEHWEICKLKRVANGFSNGTSATQITFGTTPYSVTRIETISTGSINYDKVGYVKKDSSLNRYLLKKNDVLISNINSFERVGNCAIYDGQHELYHGMNLLRITPLDNIVPEYLLYSLKSANYMGQMRRACKPAINQVSVPSSVVKGIIITFPPLSEQEEIAIYCSRALQCIEDSVDNCKKQISLLQERKQIIINDVVTGKIKVS